MERNSYTTIPAIIALTLLGAVYAAPRTGEQHQPGDKKASIQAGNKAHANQDISEMERSAMITEPHHILAAAYKENIGTFARALCDQAKRGSLSSDFARAAAAEISRSFDQADEHHREHLKTMNPEMRSTMAVMTQQMDARSAKLRNAIRLLEKDVAEYTVNSKQIASDSEDILKLLDDMPRMHQAGMRPPLREQGQS